MFFIKMDKKIIKFGDTEIEEYEFHKYKSPISVKDIDINEIVVYLISFLLVNWVVNKGSGRIKELDS